MQVKVWRHRRPLPDYIDLGCNYESRVDNFAFPHSEIDELLLFPLQTNKETHPGSPQRRRRPVTLYAELSKSHHGRGLFQL